MISGGNSRTTLSPAGIDSSPLLEQLADHRAVVDDALQAQHQAHAAHFGKDRRIARGEELQPAPQRLAHLANARKESIVENDVEHGVAHGHRQRIAAEGRAVAARPERGGEPPGRETGADRQAAAETLGDRHQIRA